MNCQDTERLIMPYINDTITDDELRGFLTHLNTCVNCREELEIYYTVDVGIRQLDAENGIYDINGELKKALENSWQRLNRLKMRSIIRYAVNTLCAISLILTFLLQCRIWWQNGMVR